MTSEQRLLVQSSFAKLTSISEVAAELFYQTLFELDPKLKLLFRGDMKEQGRRLMQMIEVAVRGLDRLDALKPALAALGARHVAYGVKDRDYETVGAAFIATLERGLGPDFTPEVKGAWIAVYTLLATTMKTAAVEAAA
jgi:hemoglobin-like flavoprotein